MHKVIEPYKHDCDRCKWVSWVCIKGETGNMYVCESGRRLEIIIRWSDEGPDYSCYSVLLDSESKPHPITMTD